VSATMQLLLLGWLTQLGLALVYNCWLMPVREQIISGGSTRRSGLPMIVFVLFNIGLPLVIVAQPGLIMLGGNWLGAVAAFGALLQLFAGLAFVYDAWQTMFR
jgi:ribulose kinase